MKNNNKKPEQEVSSANNMHALRHWAREIAQGAISPRNLSRMFLKLRVQNLELEMQNEKLRRTQAELEVAKTRYFNLYDQAPLGYCTFSEKGLIMDTNLAAANLFGVARGFLIKQSISRFIIKEDQDIYYQHRKQLFETGAPQEYELRMVKNDGTIFWAHLIATISQEVQNQTMCYVMLSDISCLKQREEELTIEKEVAKRAHLFKNQLLANLSHEIRTPLNGLMGTLQVMQMTELTMKQKEYIDVSKTSLNVLLTVLNNMLDYSKIEADKTKLVKDVFSLTKSLEDMASFEKMVKDRLFTSTCFSQF